MIKQLPLDRQAVRGEEVFELDRAYKEFLASETKTHEGAMELPERTEKFKLDLQLEVAKLCVDNV